MILDFRQRPCRVKEQLASFCRSSCCEYSLRSTQNVQIGTISTSGRVLPCQLGTILFLSAHTDIIKPLPEVCVVRGR